MRRARALCFFSLFEGFGMPLLEAFAAGTPVVCSNTTSLPEVGGDAVLACDPSDILAMADAMRRVAADAALRRDLVERGRKRLPLYTWRDSAARFLHACQRIATQTPPVSAAPLEAMHRLNTLTRQIELNCKTLLDHIHHVTTEAAAAAAQSLETITMLDREATLRLEAIHRLDSLLKQSEADRAAQRTLIQEMYNELHSGRALCRRLYHKVVARVRRNRAA
jgi:hypothetical protein